MNKKVYPNDACPCGSGKKYKSCCGSNKKATENSNRPSLALEEFVIERICEDVFFLENALQIVLGPDGFRYCQAHKEELNREYKKDRFATFVKADGLGVYEASKKMEHSQRITNIRPYGGSVPEEEYDIFTLLKKECLSIEGRQVDLFHAYLMDNLQKRFDAYLYVPDKQHVGNQSYGAFAHRGYDFFLGITLYLELQLGVHAFLKLMNIWEFKDKDREAIENYFALKDIEVNTGMLIFLSDYANVIEEIASKYSAKTELELYHTVGAYTDEEYTDRKQVIESKCYIKPWAYDYISYLRYLVSATCFNRAYLYELANMCFPQCDFLKYVLGLESIYELFEEKLENVEIKPEESVNIVEMKRYCEENGLAFNEESYVQTRLNIYHTAVFWWMDELNGMFNHSRVKELEYVDFADINDDDFTLTGGKRLTNPARKSTRISTVRRLRMELYKVLNGQCFTLSLDENFGKTKKPQIHGKYPMLPWLSSGKEATVHCKPFDRQSKTDADLYSPDLKKRQEYLTMEYRLTEIPINCIEEYLNPDVFYNWKERNELLKQTERQNEELKNMNETLKRHIQLNQELVRNLSHSSANYLNSDKLAQTGIALQKADKDNPGPERLHLEGLSLMLQSEQEMYLSRQLNSLVWRCSADVDSLSMQIRSGLSKEAGVKVSEPIEFALKTVLARVLFRENDRRSAYIKDKLPKTEEEWTQLKSSFMLDILAERGESRNRVIDWWNRYIGKLEVTYSAVWEKLLLIPEKSFYDLITEITAEQILNAMSHGDVKKPIRIELGQAEELKGRPRWTYILCENAIGNEFTGGRGVGISTLNETIMLLNSNKRGIQVTRENELFCSKVWLLASFLRAL